MSAEVDLGENPACASEGCPTGSIEQDIALPPMVEREGEKLRFGVFCRRFNVESTNFRPSGSGLGDDVLGLVPNPVYQLSIRLLQAAGSAVTSCSYTECRLARLD